MTAVATVSRSVCVLIGLSSRRTKCGVRGRAAGTKAAALTVCFWQVIGIDVLHGCKEPEKQFALVQRHIDAIQHRSEFMDSEIVVMVERNLGL